MRTGQDVLDAGLYSSDCCSVEVELARDAMFPRCPRCLSLTIWDLIEEMEEQAA